MCGSACDSTTGNDASIDNTILLLLKPATHLCHTLLQHQIFIEQLSLGLVDVTEDVFIDADGALLRCLSELNTEALKTLCNLLPAARIEGNYLHLHWPWQRFLYHP